MTDGAVSSQEIFTLEMTDVAVSYQETFTLEMTDAAVVKRGGGNVGMSIYRRSSGPAVTANIEMSVGIGRIYHDVTDVSKSPLTDFATVKPLRPLA